MRATTIRFSDPIYQRLEQASRYSGLPINAIVTAACMEWLRQQFPMPSGGSLSAGPAADAAESDAISSVLGERLRPVVPILSADVRAAIVQARDEARALNHTYLGTEHLLLGVATQVAGPGAQVLQQHGITAERVREAILFIVGRGMSPTRSNPGLTPRGIQAIELTEQLARARDDAEIHTGHLLLGALGVPGGLAAGVVESLGSSEEEIRAAVEALMS
ncbi:MAG: Clp protease N-terminal domain-containing protein [Chloroflexota bacterium]